MSRAAIPDDSIARAVADADLPAIAQRFTRLTRAGRKWQGCCPFHSEKTPSFGIFPAKSGGGWRWRCLGACNEGGDAISFLMKAEGLRFLDAIEQLGVDRPVTEEDRRRIARREEDAHRAAVKDRGFKIEAARALWRAAGPIEGTPAEAYLMSRALRGPWPETLRFHPEHKHTDDKRSFPVLLGVMAGPDGSFRGVHRTYLEPDGSGKARLRDGHSAKKMLGWSEAACVRLDPPAAGLLLAEGIESALSVRQATGRPCFAALSLSNLATPLPRVVRAVTVCVDSDEKRPAEAEESKQRAFAAHARRGLAVRVARPPAGCDFNDVLQGRGGE